MDHLSCAHVLVGLSHPSLVAGTQVPRAVATESVQIYIGYEKTLTPAHKDLCGSMGHNLMVYGDQGTSRALWCIMKGDDADKVQAFWEQVGQKSSGHPQHLDHENWFMPVRLLLEAEFEVPLCPRSLAWYGSVKPSLAARRPPPLSQLTPDMAQVHLVHQAPGDLVLLPFNAPHQVYNTVGRSVKFSWNIQTPASAEASIRTVLPVYQNLPIPRPEVYRLRLAAYCALQQRVMTLESLKEAATSEPTSVDGEEASAVTPATAVHRQRKRLQAELLPLIRILVNVLDEEALPLHETVKLLTDEEPQGRVCDICRCDIFNRAFYGRLGSKSDRFGLQLDDGETAEFDFCLRCISDMRPLPKGVQKRTLQLHEHFRRPELMAWVRRANAVMPEKQKVKSKPPPAADKAGKGSTLAMKALHYVTTTVHCHMCRKKYLDEDSLIGCGCGSCGLKYCEVCFDKHNVPFQSVKVEVEAGRRAASSSNAHAHIKESITECHWLPERETLVSRSLRRSHEGHRDAVS